MSPRTPVPSSTVRHFRDHRMRCFHDSLIWFCSVGWNRMPPLAANAALRLPLVVAAAFVARLSALLSSSTLVCRALTRASGNIPASGGFSNLIHEGSYLACSPAPQTARTLPHHHEYRMSNQIRMPYAEKCVNTVAVTQHTPSAALPSRDRWQIAALGSWGRLCCWRLPPKEKNS